ncbi:transcription factor bHLH25-like [Salvia miltiorrhiza]|uniref:transcription factor bHLH25-like n=1 Tax=Salvia miltiorrhiza TaxID=226208 RepID=UPI0025AC8196|nr:transcription factor bHLH25-like [Salvia miltiorrhiza]
MEISGFRNLADLVNQHVNDPLPVDFQSSFYEGLSHNFEQACEYDDRPLMKQFRTSSHMPATTLQFDVIPTCDGVVWMNPKDEALVASKPIPFHQHHSHNKLADHSLAERKRREKIGKRFAALSALVPGLKKMDKASILEDAIEYMKLLEEKVKGLEEKARKRSMESVVFTINKDDEDEDDFPLIRARFYDKEMLISIHCKRGRGVFEKIVGEIENLQFSIVNSSLMTYGDSSLSITLIALAQKNDEEDSMSMEQLVRNLRGLLKIIL